MGSQPPASRAALEPLATLDPAALAGVPASSPLTVRAAALSAHLLYLGTGGGKLLLFSLQDPSTPELLRLLPIGATLPVSAIIPIPCVANHRGGGSSPAAGGRQAGMRRHRAGMRREA